MQLEIDQGLLQKILSVNGVKETEFVRRRNNKF